MASQNTVSKMFWKVWICKKKKLRICIKHKHKTDKLNNRLRFLFVQWKSTTRHQTFFFFRRLQLKPRGHNVLPVGLERKRKSPHSAIVITHSKSASRNKRSHLVNKLIKHQLVVWPSFLLCNPLLNGARLRTKTTIKSVGTRLGWWTGFLRREKINAN